ncbi:nuclear protein [Cryptococcus neoformans]|nr:nuclear protein [Cryptococcus neoformans var. grubii]OXC60993.1 nuclear protein [Cryptococcus neoformans var. grubii MW-RSA852]
MNFYKSAALALDHLDKHQGSVKGSLAAAGVKASGGEAKRILALIIETLKYRPVLQQLLKTVPILALERTTFPSRTPANAPTSQSLLLVLLHDLLFSSRSRIEASDKWPPKPAVMRHQARLKAELVRIQIREGKTKKEDLAKSSGEGEAVRYIRYNPNAGRPLEELEEYLEKKGYTKLDEPVYPIPEGKYFADPHLSDVLLAFPGSANWWVDDEWYEGGGVILQDKASCFPARVLMEEWVEGEGECLDATSAPGNKTSYVSALMANRGKLHAFERSPNRFKTLEKMLAKARCSNVQAQRADFTDTDPKSKEFKNVTRILLDPSCSGSGIVNRLDYLVDDDTEESDSKTERLEKLASFQLQMVLHAFKFPSAQRIVYSTCSIHPEEDERVVMAALQSNTAKENGWCLATRESVLPKWERRGRPEEMQGDEELANGVIRCLPEDKTNGFFVSCFVRGGTGIRPKATKKLKDQQRPKRPLVEEDEEIAEEKGSPTIVVDEEGGEQAGEQDRLAVNISRREKTKAQLERAKRKKAQQKVKAKKRKVEL